MSRTACNLDRLRIYRRRRVLITGHSGFTGAWLTLWLSLLGAEVVGYALDPPTKPNLYEIFKLKKHITDIYGDVLDTARLRNVLETYEPEIVFHLAAEPIVRESYKHPVVTYQTNVMGSLNLLEAVRSNHSVKAVVIVTSEKCYRNHNDCRPLVEDDPLGGRDPYSSSKACVEILAASWQHSFFHPTQERTPPVGIATARPSNIIGGGDWATDRLIPDCMRALNSGMPVRLRNPSHMRPWQFVLNPLYGYLLLGTYLLEDPNRYCGGWNFGALEEELCTVETIAQKLVDLWGSGSYEVHQVDNQPHEDACLKMDCTKAQTRIGWQPLYDLSAGLAETVAWYRSYFAGNPESTLEQLSINQIKLSMGLVE